MTSRYTRCGRGPGEVDREWEFTAGWTVPPEKLSLNGLISDRKEMCVCVCVCVCVCACARRVLPSTLPCQGILVMTWVRVGVARGWSVWTDG